MIDFIRIAHPLDKFVRGRSVAEQMRKYLLRYLDEKFTLLILWRLKV
jgi:hypothetical protein